MGLFWKIFVSFMVAVSVTLVGGIYAVVRLQETTLEDLSTPPDQKVMEKLAEIASRQGERGLVGWLNENRRLPNNVVVLVFAEERRGFEERLDGRPRPPRWRELLNRSWPSQLRSTLSTQPVEWSQSNSFRDMQRGRPLLMPIRGPDPSQQFLVVFMKGPTDLFGILMWPGTPQVVFINVLVVAAATSLALSLYIASPIVRLKKATRALAAGALDTRVGAPINRRKDEVGTLARDFDSMAERIQALVTDKETLLRDVSHELRSPLARMRVALALAQRKVSDAAQPNLARIELEAERLDALVGQVMTLSRLRTTTEPTKKPLQLEEIVSAVVDDARFEHPDRVVNYTAPPPIPYTGDPDGLKSAVENVVRNALAYSPPDKPIDVTVERTPSTIEIRVRDRGPGVEPRHLQRIFEPFYRTDESRDHRQDGQGIGLAITARVMELHGGTVEAANCSDGGLQITFTLPAEGMQTEGERGRKRRAD